MIVVTGAAGFIGGHLVEHLAGEGHRVVAVDRRPWAGPTAAGDVTPVVADLASDRAAADLLAEADAVFHLAGAGGVRRSGPEAETAWWRDNVLATGAVLNAVPLATPLVVTSSSSVYGGSAGGRPSRERDGLAPRGGYARSKVVVERLCTARRVQGGDVAVARPFTVAGERQRPDMALARWLDAASSGRPLPVYGALRRRRDITDVREVARALALMAQRGVTGPLNLGSGVSHSLADLVAAVASAVGDVDVAVQPATTDEVDSTLADTARCRRLLGFVPVTDLPGLVRRQAEAAGCIAARPAGAVSPPVGAEVA